MALRRREEDLRQALESLPVGDEETTRIRELELCRVQEKLGDSRKSLEQALGFMADLSLELEHETALSDAEMEDVQNGLKVGDTAPAEEWFLKVLDQSDDPAEAAEAAFQLSRLAQQRIDLSAALKYLKQAVELRSDDSLYLNEYGFLLDSLGWPKRAISYYDQALALDLEAYGPDHPEVAVCWNNLAGAWASLGDCDRAIDYYEKALVIDLDTYGEFHPFIACLWNNLGRAWQQKGDCTKAIAYYEKALASDLKSLGETHLNVAIDWNNMGTAWRIMGDETRADACFKKSSAILSKLD